MLLGPKPYKMRTDSSKKVTLVGAGPGDPDLITLKGVKALQAARVVLYDALVDRRLLGHAPEALKVFVGKRKGYKRYTQTQINKLLVNYAQSHGSVVRLKGGDPFVFGRGTEEIDYLHSYGITTEVVSGLSSCIAVPASQGISLTRRGVSESFWVLTATTSENKLSGDLYLAAQSTATIVILMGMAKLKEIMAFFSDLDKAALPVAVIQDGTTDRSRMLIGTVATIAEQVREQALVSPAVIVLGEVVREPAKLASCCNDLDIHYDCLQVV